MSIAENISTIRQNIPAGVKLVCVSKFHPAEAVMEAYRAGERRFGENRPQEMHEKAPLLPGDIEWHFIGNLQTNKVKLVVPIAAVIESMSNTRLVDEIEKQAARINKVQNCLIEIHVAQEETKQGFTPEEAVATFTPEYIAAHPHINICGVMGMASNTDDEAKVANDFRQIRRLFETLRAGVFKDKADFSELSMGMSGDYRIAISEHSTSVRIGSAIFGPRQY